MGTRRGWCMVDVKTQVLLVDGKPRRVRSCAHDLDAAADRAAQWVGEPLEVYDWQNEAGEVLVNEDGSPSSLRDVWWRAECVTAAEAHDE